MARQWKWITEIRKNSQPLCSISLLRLESSSIILFLLNPVFRWFSNVLLCGSRLLQNRPKLVSSWCFRLQVQLLSSTLCSSFVCCGQSFNRSEHPAIFDWIAVIRAWELDSDRLVKHTTCCNLKHYCSASHTKFNKIVVSIQYCTVHSMPLYFK